jgi:uncharacterized protein YuzE
MMFAEALPFLALDIEGELARIGRGDVIDQLREAVIERWTYDAAADAAYVHFRPEAAVEHGETVPLFDEVGVNLDLDSRKRLAGVEIFGAGEIASQLEKIVG